MAHAIQPTTPANGALGSLDADTMNALVTGGDCSRLTPAQKTAYYAARCEAAGLDPRAQPFAFMRLNGKEVLYAQKAATDQLAAKHGLRVQITSQATEDGIRVVTVRAEAKDGRVTEEIGALPVKGLQGEALSNALMKCVTKAKRRAVLSICGLGMLDETEVESIPQAHPEPTHSDPPPAAGKIEAPPAAAAQTVEVKPPPRREVPHHVLALFQKVLAAQKGNKKLAQAEFQRVAEALFGDKPKPSNEWTEEDTRSAEAALFPNDIPF